MQACTSRIKTLVASVAFLAGGLVASSTFAALGVNPIFGSDMVLQRGVAVPVFGTGDVGATVSVSFQSQNVSTAVQSDGKWQVNLASMPASTSPSTMVVSQNGANPSTFTYTGVQVGEVWVMSGQSNMNFPMRNADYSSSYISDAANHNIRLFRMNGGSGPSTTTWTTANASTVPNFTAAGYWMGYELSMALNVPIGLIQAAHDGTNIASWQTTDGGNGADYIPMLKALQPFPIKGVAWYQGESNSGDPAYQTKLTHMINEWRTDWGNPNLWFGIVQLPYPKWNVAALAEFNVTQSVPNTYLTVTIDLYNSQILHPTDKRPVGRRLAISARGLIYGEAIETSGPVRALPPTSYVTGNKVVLNFTHLGNGLTTKDGLAPVGFQLADSGGRYVTATATIVGNTLELTAARVSVPKKLSYSYSTSGNVENRVSIPVEGGAATETMLPLAIFEMTFP